MPKASKRVAKVLPSKKVGSRGSLSRTRKLVAQIRQHREDIRQRVGTLSDSAALLREDRDR